MRSCPYQQDCVPGSGPSATEPAQRHRLKIPLHGWTPPCWIVTEPASAKRRHPASVTGQQRPRRPAVAVARLSVQHGRARLRLSERPAWQPVRRHHGPAPVRASIAAVHEPPALRPPFYRWPERRASSSASSLAPQPSCAAPSPRHFPPAAEPAEETPVCVARLPQSQPRRPPDASCACARHANMRRDPSHKPPATVPPRRRPSFPCVSVPRPQPCTAAPWRPYRRNGCCCVRY